METLCQPHQRAKYPVVAPGWYSSTTAASAPGLVERLKQDGHDVITVKAGSEFRILSETEFSLLPISATTTIPCLDKSPAGPDPDDDCSPLNLTPPAQTEPGLPSISQPQDLGFYSLLFLAQALEAQGYSHDLHIAAISNGLQDVTGQTVVSG